MAFFVCVSIHLQLQYRWQNARVAQAKRKRAFPEYAMFFTLPPTLLLSMVQLAANKAVHP
jgi:hypothetical protein